MITIFVRTLLLYALLIGAMRIMGKRQIGELEISDLVTTLLLSEIASMPITDPKTPLVYAVIPIITLLSIEVITSMLLTKWAFLKTLFGGKPSMLIKKGVLLQKELTKNRISLDELLSELRQKDVANIDDVDYAILERNGKISITLKTADLAHPIVIDGKISAYNLSIIGKSEKWVLREAKRRGYDPEDVFLLTVTDSGKINIYRKEK